MIRNSTLRVASYTLACRLIIFAYPSPDKGCDGRHHHASNAEVSASPAALQILETW